MSRYQIELKGQLNLQWKDWFDLLEMVHLADGKTRLIVELPDQAALFGLLLRLQGLGLEIIKLSSE